MENSIVNAVETAMNKSAEDNFLSKISPMLLGGAGAGLVGAGAGAFLTKRRKGPDGEEEDGSEYRKRVLRNASMLGGLGVVGGVGGGALYENINKLVYGTPGADGKVPVGQGSEAGNMAEHFLAHPGIAALGGGAGAWFGHNRWKPTAVANEFLGSAEKLALKLKDQGLSSVSDKGVISNGSSFAKEIRHRWKDKGFRNIVDSYFDKDLDRNTFYAQAGLDNPRTSVIRSLKKGVNKIPGINLKLPAGHGPTGGIDKLLTGVSRVPGSKKIMGMGKRRGKVGAAIGLGALLPALLGTYVDDHNK